jgi:long-chain acyl-CoA synthetase
MQAKAAASPPRIDFDAMPTLGDIVRYHARVRGTRPVLTFEGRTTSWVELDRASNRVANALQAAGCEPGDRIAYLGKGTDQFFELMFGVAKAGCVLTPVQWRLALPEVEQILSDARPTLLFIDHEQLTKLDALRALGFTTSSLLAMDPAPDGQLRYARWRDAASDTDRGTPIDANLAALQLYTSGTTGLPKGVMLSHRNLLSGRREAMREHMEWNEWLEDDVSLVALPVGHIGGVGWAIVGFFNGAHTIVQREFIPPLVLDALERQRVSKLFVVPTALHMLLLQPRVREIDYSRLRHILYGASPIALELLREATQVFGCGFCQQYGMTETAGTIVYLPPDDHDPRGNARMRSAGRAMPGVEIRVVDAVTRQPLPCGRTGEVETRSIANMVGYWNRADATAETINDEGWLRTGDAGYLDEEGYLYILDRFKDMIVSGAENIYPAEVENAIFGHPAVQEVAVIGVPDDAWGEAVKAIVVLKPAAAADASEIIAFARTRIAGFKAPKTVDFVAALPRGPTGKILRRTLREPYWAGRVRQVN